MNKNEKLNFLKEEKIDDKVNTENPNDFIKKELKTKILYDNFKKSNGLNHKLTLDVAFKLMDLYIIQYKLDKIDTILLDIENICSSEEHKNFYWPKYIQMKAFCRWKQSKFKEALKLFKEMEQIIGPSSKLLENMGHTYNSLSDYKNAEKCFKQAIVYIEIEKKKNPDMNTNMGGLYLGLGLIKKRQGNIKEGLNELHKGLDWYTEHTGPNPHSLVAKASMSVGQTYNELKEYDKAIEHIKNAIDIFQKTCGDESPLTGNAQYNLGKIYFNLKKDDLSWKYLMTSFFNQVNHDSLNIFNLFDNCNMIFNLLKSKNKETDYKFLIKSLQKLDLALESQTNTGLVPIDGNVGVLYKIMCEILILLQYYKLADSFISKTVIYLKKEKSLDCSKLIQESMNISMLLKNLISKNKGKIINKN